MTPTSGAARIFFYNWPTYVGTWLVAAVAIATAARHSSPASGAVLCVAIVAILWSFVSLVVSRYIYDKSSLASGTWIAPLLPWPCDSWSTIHAGLDAEIALDAVMPGRCAGRLDVFDPRVMTAPSITRARVRTPSTRPATECSPTRLSLDDGSCDVVVVAFTAHEIRDRDARERFFDEVRRSLRVGGRMLLVEHIRDVANFVAFGPGFLHFLPRAEWMRLASRSSFTVHAEERITPWVMALVLEKPS